MPYVSSDEYKELLTIKERYEWLIKQAFIGASVNSYDTDRLYIRSGVLDEELRRYHIHDYRKKLHELKAKKGGKRKHGY